MEENMNSLNLSNNYGSVEQMEQKRANDSIDKSSTNTELFNKNSEESLISRVGSCIFKMKIEIFTFLFTFSPVLTKVTSTTMILEKVCLIHFEFNSSVCDDLENYTDVKNSAEKLATNYQLGHTLIQTAPAAVLACFIGPWSDRYGRKFPILLALIGMLLDSVGSSICAYFMDSRVEYYFIPALFTGLSGGVVTIMAIIYSYGSDSTTLFERTMKYAFIEMSVGFATSFGATTGGWIYKGLGFAPVFLFTAGGLIVSLVFGIFMIEETRGSDNNDSWSTKIRNLASCEIFLEGFTAITKHRPDRGRRQIILLITSMCFLIIAMNSNVMGLLGGCATFAARSRISKVARDDGVGKLFTFVATAESLLPILTSVLMSQVFVACLSFFPGMPYIALGIFLLLPLGVFIWMTFLPKMTYQSLQESPTS